MGYDWFSYTRVSNLRVSILPLYVRFFDLIGKKYWCLAPLSVLSLLDVLLE
jgi:hypothetical protein